MDKDRKKKIIILFFFALFSVSIVAIAFFVLCNKKSNHKTLIDYSPKNAIFFLEINLSGKNLKNFLNKGNATETVLEKFFSAVVLGFWVAYWLALEYKIDPTPIKTIEEFKRRLDED